MFAPIQYVWYQSGLEIICNPSVRECEGLLRVAARYPRALWSDHDRTSHPRFPANARLSEFGRDVLVHDTLARRKLLPPSFLIDTNALQCK